MEPYVELAKQIIIKAVEDHRKAVSEIKRLTDKEGLLPKEAERLKDAKRVAALTLDWFCGTLGTVYLGYFGVSGEVVQRHLLEEARTLLGKDLPFAA